MMKKKSGKDVVCIVVILSFVSLFYTQTIKGEVPTQMTSEANERISRRTDHVDDHHE